VTEQQQRFLAAVEAHEAGGWTTTEEQKKLELSISEGYKNELAEIDQRISTLLFKEPVLQTTDTSIDDFWFYFWFGPPMSSRYYYSPYSYNPYYAPYGYSYGNGMNPYGPDGVYYNSGMTPYSTYGGYGFGGGSYQGYGGNGGYFNNGEYYSSENEVTTPPESPDNWGSDFNMPDFPDLTCALPSLPSISWPSLPSVSLPPLPALPRMPSFRGFLGSSTDAAHDAADEAAEQGDHAIQTMNALSGDALSEVASAGNQVVHRLNDLDLAESLADAVADCPDLDVIGEIDPEGCSQGISCFAEFCVCLISALSGGGDE